MRIEQGLWSAETGWDPPPSAWNLGPLAQVVYLFGDSDLVRETGCFDLVRKAYPKAHLFGCSTAGEIQDSRVTVQTIALTAAAFEQGHVAAARSPIQSPERSFDAGQDLVHQLDPDGLRHIFVLCEGIKVNASEFVRGIDSALPKGVTVSGGCAGDGNRLTRTHVWCNGQPEESTAVALGFYGASLRVGVAAMGGWRPFGPIRLIEKAKDNVLYELDGRPALALYKQYLGEYAAGLPATGLMFPLELRQGAGSHTILRALLAVNEDDQSITFSGDVPEGAYARFTVGSFEDLIEGARVAAAESLRRSGGDQAELSLVVSCNGRRFVLKQRTEEETEAVRAALGSHTAMAGFYSYGEIAPAERGGASELHNETITVTCFSER